MAKYMHAGLEWDEVTAMATAAYNYFPNMSAKESAFFLMYGRDLLNKLSAILNAPRRYLGDATGFPDLEALKNMYQMVAQQLMNSRERYVKSNRYNKVPDHGILVGRSCPRKGSHGEVISTQVQGRFPGSTSVWDKCSPSLR